MNDIQYFQEPFTAYKEYCAVKAHFTTINYDYIKYKGEMKRITHKSFEKRNDKMFFDYLARNYSRNQSTKFFISQFVENENAYIGDFVLNKEECTHKYKIWSNRIKYVWENYKTDIFNISTYKMNWKEVLLTNNANKHPFILTLYVRKRITIETIVLLDNLFGFMEKNKTTMKDDMIYDNYLFKFKNYSSFLICDKEKIASYTPKNLLTMV